MAGVPGQRGGAVPQGLDGDRAARAPRAAHHAAGARPRRPASSTAVGWDEALDHVAARLAQPPGRARQRRRRRLRRRRADQREGLPARQARPGRARHQPDRLQRPLVHELGRVRRPTRRSASTAGCRSRWPTSSRPTCSCSSAPTSPRPCRRPRATSTGCASAAAGSWSSTPVVRRPPSAPTCSCSRCRAPTSPLALGVLHLLDAAGAVDEDYVAARTTGFDDVRRSVAAWWPERVERVSGVEAARAARARRRCSPAPRRSRCSPPAAPSSTARAPRPCSPGSTSRSRSACAASRTPATAASPGRATARAGASTARRPTSCPATG